MRPLRVHVAGIGAWSAGHQDWPSLRAALLGRSCEDNELRDELRDTAVRRPSAVLLPPAERRRVPDGVAVALAVASEALATTALETAVDRTSLSSVFASAHGDLAIVDYLCATLAADPTAISPTRFHHSVHNAAAGYWSIATAGMGPSTSLAAGNESFAVGLLEAATQVMVEARPVLLVAFETPTVGLLARTVSNTRLFGAALLLMPTRDERPAPRLSLAVDPRSCEPPLPGEHRFHALAASNAAARSLALLEALARGREAQLAYPINAHSTVSVNVRYGEA